MPRSTRGDSDKCVDDVKEWKTAVEDLQARLREEIELRTELERRCHLLEKLAHRDPTTGLKTESYLRVRVQEEIDRAIRHPASASLLTLCAPGNRYEAIPELGRFLRGKLRASDHVFSLSKGGLAILLLETPAEGAHTALKRLAADLEEFIRGYGFAVTSFPLDAHQADPFLDLAMSRHNKVVRTICPEAAGASPSLQ